ncbi:hypothetical protein CEUSTIGMA_g6364.t1 [Chlamydomonas eustigma]|uniref:Chitin-binding type-2 domain-containing protein n=1 Tax=Chlamydomonas eustigma TaxID=1157962 RepID=A0A250X784_9CHLO|nr:hypothetical protein CEUSTIGMA_g6364.t1 [Chlamydomonas eustigma]|eukprot:GAX78925.1 hypothetical protein CEUSTIGMA_g6364.t1 [Chlamydomonas eustigma]
MFNPSIQVCDYPSNTICSQPSSPLSPSPTSVFSPPPLAFSSPPSPIRSSPPNLLLNSPPSPPPGQTTCTGTPQARAACFCATAPASGMFADVQGGCAGFFSCSPGISAYTSCPSNLIFSNRLQLCDYTSDVSCVATPNPPLLSSSTHILSPPSSPLPPPAPPAPPAPPVGAWQGWATTTQFGSGETSWPSGVAYAENLTIINSASSLPYPTMGAAIPWRFYCKKYGGRSELLKAVYNAWTLKNASQNVCFQVQPIRVTPSQLAQGSYDLPSLQQAKSTVYDVNDDSIQALDAIGNPYPIYQIVPYEGCGGNCVAQNGSTTSDCFNDCIASISNATVVNQVLECNFASAASNVCMGMNTLWSGGAWPNTPAERTAFGQYSANTAINFANGLWQTQTTAGYLNWCSGFNLHFDIALDSPYWAGIAPSASAPPSSRVSGDLTNILVRYRQAPCKPW